MAADPNIFQSYLNPVKSVAEYSNELDKQEQNALTLAASRISNRSAQQSYDDDQTYRTAAAESGGDQNALVKALYAKGLAQKAQAIQASGIDLAHKQSQTLNENAAAAERTQKTKDAEQMAHLKAAGMIQTPEDALAWSAAAVKKGIMTPEMFQAGIQRIPADPQGLQQWKGQVQQGGLTVLEQMHSNEPKPVETRLGNVVKYLDMNPRSSTFGKEVTPAQDIGQSADNAETNKTSIDNNKRTVGASLTNAAATRDVAAATRYAATAQRDQSTEMKLADDYRAQSKEFGAATSAYKQINATLDSATTSPAATLAAATKFMKILDPGSVVRESELGMALAASGVLDRAQNYVNTLQRGKVLTPTQVADFKDISQKMYGAAQQVQQAIDTDYKGKAKAYGLRPEMVTQELGQSAESPADMREAVAAEMARRAAAKPRSAGVR